MCFPFKGTYLDGKKNPIKTHSRWMFKNSTILNQASTYTIRLGTNFKPLFANSSFETIRGPVFRYAQSTAPAAVDGICWPTAEMYRKYKTNTSVKQRFPSSISGVFQFHKIDERSVSAPQISIAFPEFQNHTVNDIDHDNDPFYMWLPRFLDSRVSKSNKGLVHGCEQVVCPFDCSLDGILV